MPPASNTNLCGNHHKGFVICTVYTYARVRCVIYRSFPMRPVARRNRDSGSTQHMMLKGLRQAPAPIIPELKTARYGNRR
ncbi:hypothetical protein ARZXY2_2300 [Arthrobacter sp. ZXY-2]|nr:hypothetical protein ARZXY2_2300 [Arthrobacter sp. ZXY-2]